MNSKEVYIEVGENEVQVALAEVEWEDSGEGTCMGGGDHGEVGGEGAGVTSMLAGWLAGWLAS